MLSGIVFPDYVLNAQDMSDDPDAFFVFTGAINLGTMHHYMRRSYKTVLTDLIDATDAANRAAAAATRAAKSANIAAAAANAAAKGLPVKYQATSEDADVDEHVSNADMRSECPTEAESSALNDEDEHSGTGGWLWWPLGVVMNVLSARCNISRSQIPKMAIEYWSQLDVPIPPTGMIFFAQGARFAASRERIRQRPLAEYKRLLALVSTDEDPCHNYLNEWLWYHIIGKPQEPKCDATPFGSIGSNEMYVVSESAQAYATTPSDNATYAAMQELGK